MAKHYIYRFKAELQDYKPKIWRTFEIDGGKTMAELGYVLQIMFEMQASHLFCFRDNVGERFQEYMRQRFTEEELLNVSKNKTDFKMPNWYRYEITNEGDDVYLNDDEELYQANEIKLRRITSDLPWSFMFEYDYGDGWEVRLELLDCEEKEVSLANYPRVLEGKGFGIIEDVGGVGGLAELAAALKKGKGQKYDDMCAWLGSTTLNLNEFDIDDCNFRLKKCLRMYRDIYELNYEPTKRSMDILLRKYKDKGTRGY